MAMQAPPSPPDPLEVIDAVGDVVMHVPRLPAEVCQRIGNATQRTSSAMEAAVRRTTEIPNDAPPDPVTFIANGVDYVVAIPRGVFEGAAGVFNGVVETFNSAMTRIQRLSK